LDGDVNPDIAGTTMEMRMPMIAITIISSIRVKPDAFFIGKSPCIMDENYDRGNYTLVK